MIPCACLHLWLKARLTQTFLSCGLLLVVVVLVVGHPRPSRVRAPVCSGCPCRDPRGCDRVPLSRMTLRQSANPLSCWLESWCSVTVVFVVVVVKRVRVYLRTLTHLLDWKRLFNSCQSYSFSIISFVPFVPSVPFAPKISAVGVPTTRHLVEDLIEILLLAVCSVAIHLVHANTNLFVSTD